jgi:hypothetical protein
MSRVARDAGRRGRRPQPTGKTLPRPIGCECAGHRPLLASTPGEPYQHIVTGCVHSVDKDALHPPAARHGLLLTVVRSEGITALVATHDEALMDLADEIIRLEDGQIAG